MILALMFRVVALHTLLAGLAIVVFGTSSQAESYLSDSRVSFGHHMPDRSDSAFYRSWADSSRDAPRDLGAGKWLLETDRRTHLAYPRLVALGNGASVTRANAALEAMHGRILRT